MKKVFSSSEDVIHLFAQQSQDEARNASGNIYFKKPWNSDKSYGTEIYSYGSHYLLGEFLDDNTILINDSGYSVTTSKHISQLRYATRQYKQFFVRQTDINNVYYEISGAKDKLAKARKPELYLSTIHNLWESLKEYHEWNRKRNKLSTKNYLLYTTDKYKEIKRIVKAISSNDENFLEKIRKAAKAEEKRKAAADKKRLKESLAKFKAYEINSFRIGDEDYLRISQDGSQVETSQGVRVSRENATMLYQAIQKGIDIKGRHIEHYTVTSINGHLVIGCHNINMDSVHEVGSIL